MHASRRRFLATSALGLGVAIATRRAQAILADADTPAAAPRHLTRLVLAGPPASVSNPLVRIAESGALADLADEVRFIGWRDPDQLRVMTLDGKADVLAMPVNVAANLYNRGAKLRLVNVSAWGILWIVSRDPDVHTLKDLVGKEVAMPFRGDMPDIVFSLLAEREGIDPRNDLRLRYVASPIDAMQLLLLRRVDHALLAEPAVSMALRKSGSFPVSLVAPELYRAIDLQQEWKRAFGGDARIPQAGIAVLGPLRDSSDAVARIAAAYRSGLAWCQANAKACGEIVAKQVPMLSAEAIADAVGHGHMDAVPAREARPALESLFRLLLQKSPGLVGGKLPPDDFYASLPATSAKT
ncbi:MAG: ABC transporter substrate-binding protein [Burkholderiaceae bacterium]|nr:ABC transporter substrate-binding protein [Burkholderiaceae bacterium]